MFDNEFGEFVWPSGREHDLGPRCNGRTGDGCTDAGRRADHNDPSAGCIGARGGYASWVHGDGGAIAGPVRRPPVDGQAQSSIVAFASAALDASRLAR